MSNFDDGRTGKPYAGHTQADLQEHQRGQKFSQQFDSGMGGAGGGGGVGGGGLAAGGAAGAALIILALLAGSNNNAPSNQAPTEEQRAAQAAQRALITFYRTTRAIDMYLAAAGQPNRFVRRLDAGEPVIFNTPFGSDKSTINTFKDSEKSLRGVLVIENPSNNPSIRGPFIFDTRSGKEVTQSDNGPRGAPSAAVQNNFSAAKRESGARMTVNVPSVDLCVRPEDRCAVAMTLHKGNQVEVLGGEGRFPRVQIQTSNGLLSGYVKTTGPAGQANFVWGPN